MSEFGVISRADYAGTDQGVDFSGAGKIPALDDVTITALRRVSIIEGGTYPLVGFQFNSGPFAGRYGYVMENFTPTVRVGQHLRRGDAIGTAKGASPYIEYGLASGPDGTPAAPLYPNPHSPKPEGEQMWAYMQSLISGKPTSSSGGVPAPSTTPTGQPASFLGSPVGTTEALAVRLAFGLAGVALLVVALVLWSRAVSSKTIIAAAGGFLAGEQRGKGRKSPPQPRSRPPASNRVTHVYRDETAAERRRRMAEGAEPSDEIPF